MATQFATLLAMDGSSIRVNVNDGIAALEAVPTSLLPSGVTDGTYIVFDSALRIPVQGTVAATATALDSAGALPAGAIWGVFNMATGVALLRNAAAVAAGLTAANLAAGSAQCTITSPAGGYAIGTAAVSAGSADVGTGFVGIGPIAATTFDVQGRDAAGVAADVNFWILIIPPPS